MNSRWRTFLEDAGAAFAGGRVADFGNPARELQVATTGSTLADLSHRGSIAVTGADALSFLQGQLTNDVARLTAERSLLCGYCTPQGRLLAVLRAVRIGDALCLRLPAEIVAGTIERLRKYVLAAKVTLEDAGDAWVGIGCAGPDSAAELGDALGGAVPQTPGQVVHARGLAVIRLPGAQPRFEILGRVEAVTPLWSALDVRAAPVGAAAWELLDILAGIPVIYPETVDRFVPQMVNLEALGGVSFEKGCYTGQEIVARLHYRGAVKRRMYIARTAAGAALAPGTPIYRAGATEALGALLTASPAPEGGQVALAVVMTQHAAAPDLRLAAPDGPAVRLAPPPYPLADGDG